MASILGRFVFAACIAALLTGCTFTFGDNQGSEVVSTSEPEAEPEAELKSEPNSNPDPEPNPKAVEPAEPILAGTIKPDLDFSKTFPDCVTAAQRIKENVQIGMTLADVRRLVGQPKVDVFGTWRWASGITFGAGVPSVRYSEGQGANASAVTSFSASADGC